MHLYSQSCFKAIVPRRQTKSANFETHSSIIFEEKKPLQGDNFDSVQGP